MEARAEVAGRSFSHPGRLVWPDLGITKLDLARYHAAVADWIVPHLAGRPLTLVRCAGAVGDGCSFMRHRRAWAPGPMRVVRIAEKTKTGEYLVVDDREALLTLVQMDIVEIHTWNSRAEDVERPDRIVLDLDPGPALGWGDVVAGARALRRVFSTLGLESFVKTTGGKGLHVVVPLVPERRWEECLAFARGIAELLARERPDLFTVAMPKRGREKKLLVDYLRNNRTNTSVAAFSPRARAGAPVSMPLAWAELGARDPWFDVRTAPRRLKRLRRDPWASYASTRQRLSDAALRALATH